MSERPPRIEVDAASPRLRRIVARGAIAAGAHASRVHAPSGALRIEHVSLVGPAVSVLWDAPRIPASGPPAREDTALGASEIAWYGCGDLEPWKLRAQPYPPLRWGRPDPARRWALVAREVLAYRPAIERFAREHRMQLHFAGRPGQRGVADSVWWGTGRRGLVGLMSKMDVVFAPPGPFAWDALRAGAFVIDPTPPDPRCRELAERRLAHVVPWPLVEDVSFWSRLIAGLSADHPLQGGTRAFYAEAQARTQGDAPEPGLAARAQRAQRKLRKLRRDPGAFWADSWLAAWRSVRLHPIARSRSLSRIALPSGPQERSALLELGDAPTGRFTR